MPKFSVENPIACFQEEKGLTLNYENIFGEKATRDKVWEMGKPGPVANTLEFPESVAFDVEVMSTIATGTHADRGAFDKRVMLKLLPTGSKGPARMLPWDENKCTYMHIDGKAHIAFTGPLSGCNIFVAGDPTSPWFFHTNYNEEKGSLDTGNTTKRKMVLDLISAGALGDGAYLIGGSLERQAYATLGFSGFVFGFKKGKIWEFYFYGSSDQGTIVIKRFF